MGDKGVRATHLSRLLRGLSRVSMLTGLALIAWPVYVTTDSAIAQWSGRRQLAAAAQGAHAMPPNSALADQRETIVVRTPGATAAPSAPPGTVLGQFEVPRLGLSYVLLEGTDNQTLGRSVGHVEGTGLPGGPGNISIAGHRDTHFRKLEWIHRDDEIVLTARDGTRDVYSVEWSRLFAPGDIQVLDESHGPAVTLITCFPFEYVGSAPLRLVVRALPVGATKTRLIASAQRQ
jgi:sortase A